LLYSLLTLPSYP